MPLPSTVRVKLSSEAAGSISLTPVVAQDLAFADLLATIMSATSEDPTRVAEILKRGSIVTGATRYRWEPLEPDPDDVAAAVQGAPRSDPARPFAALACVRAVIRSGRLRIEISREAGRRRRLFSSRCFWDELLEAASLLPLNYVRYLHRDGVDQYSAAVDPSRAARLQVAGRLLRFRPLALQVSRNPPSQIDFFVERL